MASVTPNSRPLPSVLSPASLAVRELQTMLSRFESNNFSICDDLLLELGVGCYPLGAMVNHSCDPNCAVTYVSLLILCEPTPSRALTHNDGDDRMS